MSYTKKKFALWLTPETKELVERCYQLDNSQSQSEFIERAIQFYTGYLEAEQDGTYLPVTVSAVLEGSLGALGDRLGKLLFKMSVEMSMASAPKRESSCLSKAFTMVPIMASTLALVASIFSPEMPTASIRS